MRTALVQRVPWRGDAHHSDQRMPAMGQQLAGYADKKVGI
jgi:hypothetical protein